MEIGKADREKVNAVEQEELVLAARQGDRAAFGRLVQANQDRIYNLAFRMTGRAEDAADLTQEAFLRAWRSLAGFQGNSSFSTWLYRLASNVCIDFLRREKRREEMSMTLEGDEGEGAVQLQLPDERWSPEYALERRELQHAVEQGLAALSPEHRQIILLREIEGLSYQEIAQCLELEEGTVKSRLARARLALRDILQKGGNFSPPPSSKQ